MKKPGLTRAFKGIWLARELYLDKRFNWTEKILLCEIDSLDADERGCYASNEYLGEFLDKTPGTVSNMIAKLKEMGALTVVFFDGKNRGLRSIVHQPAADEESLDRDPGISAVVVATENVLGFHVDEFTRGRIDEIVPIRFMREWLELIKNRLVGNTHLRDSQMKQKIGYWLGDFKKDIWRYEKDADRAGSDGHGVNMPNPDAARSLCVDCKDTAGLVQAQGGKGMTKCRHPEEEVKGSMIFFEPAKTYSRVK